MSEPEPGVLAPRMSPGLFLACLLFALLGAFVAAVYVYRPAWGWFLDDYTLHLQFARQLANGVSVIPHTGFHRIVIALAWLTGLNLRMSTILVVALATAASVYLVYRLVATLAPRSSQPARLWAMALAMLASSMVVTAIVPNWYFGQGSPNVWHSPTWMVMQPFGLWVFLLFVEGRFDRRAMALAGGLLAVSVWIKPNFAIAFLPACWAWMLLRRRPMLVSVENVLLSVPSLFLLGAQFVSEYLAPGSNDGVAFDPFAVWSSLSNCIPCSIVMATVFPLLVFAVRRTQVLRSDAAVITLFTFLFAFLQYGLLAETGERFFHANWMWGYNYAQKLLFVVAAGFLIQDETPPWARKAGWAALGLHALFGVRHLVRAMLGLGIR